MICSPIHEWLFFCGKLVGKYAVCSMDPMGDE